MAGPLLAADDVRAMFALVGELRELGDDPNAWRAHLAAGLASLCGCRASVAMELVVRTEEPAEPVTGSCNTAVRLVTEAAHGVTRSETGRFYDEVFWFDHAADHTLDAMVPLYGSAFTRTRASLAPDEAWYRSSLANERFRPNDCDDFITSMSPVHGTELTLSSVMLYRAWRDARFGDRERALVEILHEELARDFAEADGPATKLTPRARQVLACLARGDSEKEIAAALEISTHTVHDHVKAIHRAFRVRSRGELLHALSRGRRSRVRLASRTDARAG